VETHSITPDYFKTMGVPLLQGRGLSAEDEAAVMALDQRRTEASEANVKLPAEQTNAMVYPVVINEKMAKYFWPNQDPIGKMFSYSEKNGPWRQVVGVVGDVKQWGLWHEAVPEAYSSFDGERWIFIVAHTSSALDLTPEVRRAVAQVDPGLSLFQVRTMDEVIGENASGQQFLAGLLGLFAGLAIVLAAVGIYGVLSYLVTQREREIGIRMSLGATRNGVLSLVLKRGMRLALIGFAIGLIGAFAAGGLIASVLHMVRPRDPAIMVLAPIILAAVVLFACYVPAQRAAKVDPMVALRQE